MVVEYEPYKDNLYKYRMNIKIRENLTFHRVFDRKLDLTKAVISDLRNIANPNHQWVQNTIISVHGETGCQPKNSKVLMYDGSWKKIQDIKIGDVVMSFDNEMKSIPSEVLKTVTWSCKENYDVFQLNRHKKKLYSCSFNHIIPFNKRKTHRLKNAEKRKVEYVIEELPARALFLKSDAVMAHHITGITCPPIRSFGKNDCKIDPYALGVYVSDGSFRYKRNKDGKLVCYLYITSNDTDVMDKVSEVYPPLNIRKKKGTTCKTYSWSINSEFAKLLKKYGYDNVLSEKKFIPFQALKSSLSYRKRLLAGLIDGDGYFSKGTYTFCQKSYKLIKDIEFLVWSIGGFVNHITKKKGTIKKTNFVGDYWYISLRISKQLKLPIITERRKPKKSPYLKTNNQVAIKLKKRNQTETVYGFTLNSPTGYYITDNWMLTHNSGKSLSIMSLGKYVFKNFSYRNMFFFDQAILDNASRFPKNSFLVRDENPAKAIFGVGSMQVSNQFTVMAETCRKWGLNLGLVEPEFVRNGITKLYLETIDFDPKRRITRLGVIEPATLKYMGAIYLPMLPENDKDWVKYNEYKDKFIENVKSGKMAGAKMDYNREVKKLLDEIDLNLYSKKKERKVFIMTKYPALTNGQVDIISTLLEIELKKKEEDEADTEKKKQDR